MQVAEAINHARDVRNRLRFPVNAKPDFGIDLKRKPVVIQIAEPEPLSQPVTIGTPDDLAFGPVVHAGESEHVPTCAAIITATAKYFDLAKVDVLSDRRQADLCTARHVAMYLCQTLTLKSLPFIGRIMGGKDHTTVLAGTRRIQAEICAGNAVVIGAIDTLTAQFGGR